ncbi:MAG: isoaspartyl aminopeptidase, partial [Segetibacter sp.]|nr:isoaspartyl aminopeptidase [Segetibacter sp.]
SCTGHGEVFIRAVAAYDVSALMEYKGLSVLEACNEVVLNKLVKMEGEGGLIGVDKTGNYALVFNSAGMYRGVKSSDGTNEVTIYQ